MPTNYPSSLDALANPTSSDSLSSPSHSGQHSDINDAMEAVQAELGVNPSGAVADVAARLGQFQTLYNLFNTGWARVVNAGESLQAAYDALPGPTGDGVGGVLLLGPGGHDVGSGLNLDRRKAVTIRSLGRWTRRVSTTGFSTFPTAHNKVTYLYSGSGSPTSLVNMLAPAGVNSNAYGFAFEGLWFVIDKPGIKYAIDAPCVNFGKMIDCGIWVGQNSGDQDVIGLYNYVDSTRGDDASWWIIDDIYFHRCGVAQFGRATGGDFNSNRHRIRNLNGFGWGKTNTTQKPILTFYGVRGATVDGVNVEGESVGILLGKTDGSTSGSIRTSLCEFGGLAGETSATIVKISGADNNILRILGSHTTFTAGDKLVQITEGTGNQITTPALSGVGNLYDRTGVADETAAQNNWVYAPSEVTGRTLIRQPGLITMSGAPEGAVVGRVGDHFHRLDGPPWLYVKETGFGTNTGWVSKIA